MLERPGYPALPGETADAYFERVVSPYIIRVYGAVLDRARHHRPDYRVIEDTLYADLDWAEGFAQRTAAEAAAEAHPHYAEAAAQRQVVVYVLRATLGLPVQGEEPTEEQVGAEWARYAGLVRRRYERGDGSSDLAGTQRNLAQLKRIERALRYAYVLGVGPRDLGQP